MNTNPQNSPAPQMQQPMAQPMAPQMQQPMAQPQMPPMPQATPQAPYASMVQGQPQPGLQPVNKVVYLLLAFFLGGFGAQKFYEGKALIGVVCLIFCWTFIPTFIAIYDLIRVACMPADAYGNVYL